MAETRPRDELPPEWMSEEETRAEGQAATGKLVNEVAVPQKKVTAPRPPRPHSGVKGMASNPRPRSRL